MTALTPNVAAGFRRHDAAFLAAEAAARRFDGLARDITPGRVLAAFKRAARTMGVPRSLVQLIDQLFARTQPQDWQPGCEPIVWVRNERLADELSISVRQLQNLLRRAVELQLVSMKDSPNGHRGGRRGPNGAIIWAYGIDLRPLGTRYGELLRVAEAADIEQRRRDELRRRLTIARKAIAQIAQTALEAGISGADWTEEVELARMAAAHARTIETVERLQPIVERLEARREALLTIFKSSTPAPAHAEEHRLEAVNISPIGEADCTDSTTTTEPLSSKEHTYAAWRKRRSDRADPEWLDKETSVTRDLEKYGVGADFVADVCSRVCWELSYGPARWDDLVALAQREGENLGIARQAWNEAVRVMGRTGAAAAVISIIHKADIGLVEKPGAYLRGMTAKAAAGELQLGRTYHGFREASDAPSPALGESASAARAIRKTSDVVRSAAQAWRADR